ncbi:MAG: hypothetical protein ABI873_18755 [Marmoricola sp.]
MHRLRFVATLALALALGTPTAGCGSRATPAQSGQATTHDTTVSAADRACRDRWHVLSNEVGVKAARGVLVRRAFESRWESIGAGIGYYESTANAGQCGALLIAQAQAIRDLEAVVAKSLPYDVAQRAAAATDQRLKWRAANPNKPEPKAVRQAYRNLRSQVPPAGRDLSPALTELAALDPASATAVSRGVHDLALLAETSSAFNACQQALAKVQAFVHRAKKSG